MKKVVRLGIMAVLVALVMGCSQTLKPGDYDAADVGKLKKVSPGMVVSMRPVNIRNKMDSNGSDVVANDNSIVRAHGFEYVIKMANGAIISLVQTEDLQLKPKQHVLVIYGETTRIVPDNGSDEY